MDRHFCYFSLLLDKFFLTKFSLLQPKTLIFWGLGIWFFGQTTAYATLPTYLLESATNNEDLSSNDADSFVDTVKLEHAIIQPTFSFTALDGTTVKSIAHLDTFFVGNKFASTESASEERSVLLRESRSKPLQSISISTFLKQNPRKQKKAALLLVPVNSTHHQTLSKFYQVEQQVAAAGPENFNPGLLKPPPSPPINPPSSPSLPPPLPETPEIPEIPETPIFDLEPAPFISFDELQVDLRGGRDNFGQRNQFIELTQQFRFGEEPALFQLKTGFNSFEQSDIETVTNIPLQLGWQTQFGEKKVQVAAGVDIFNRLPTALNFNAQIAIPITKRLTFTGFLEHGPYKANAETLSNQIKSWRFGPNFYWQIDRSTSFFSSFRIGLYNDGNREQQSFSRLERRFGQFYVAANVFNWIFSDDVQEKSGYFSPPDFFVYNGEIGWQGNPFEFLRCQVNTNVGRQRLNGRVTKGNTYQARCTLKLSRQIELDFGYAFTNVANRDTGDRVYENRSLLGQLRVNF